MVTLLFRRALLINDTANMTLSFMIITITMVYNYYLLYKEHK